MHITYLSIWVGWYRVENQGYIHVCFDEESNGPTHKITSGPILYSQSSCGHTHTTNYTSIKTFPKRNHICFPIAALLTSLICNRSMTANFSFSFFAMANFKILGHIIHHWKVLSRPFQRYITC